MSVLPRKYYLILLLISLISIDNLFAQDANLECGTTVSEETLNRYINLREQIKEYENDFLVKSSNYQRNPNNIIYSIPIKAHIVRNSDGTGGISLIELDEAIENLNETYSQSFLTFYIDKNINYIDNDVYCHFNKNDETTLTHTYNEKGFINIYFFDKLKNSSDESICGSTNNSDDVDTILIKNSCVTNGSSLSHEIGHFFSLLHTHGIHEGLTTELVNGTNCDTDGDGICDTPADPKLSYSNVDKDCNYTEVKTDANGDVFNPDTSNIMSYSRKSCRTHLSTMQLARVYAFFKASKFYLTDVEIEDSNNGIENLKLYPNPVTNNELFIKLDNTEKAISYRISNLLGQVYKTGIYNSLPINVEYLSSGTYLLTINNGETTITKKFIKY